MKKSLIACLSLLVTLSLLIGAAGCGGGSSANATEVLKTSSAKMKNVEKFKVEAEIKTSADMEGADQDIDMEMASDMSNPEELKAQIVVSGMGVDTEVYLYGAYTYINIPGQGWVKAATSDMSDYEQMTPSGISDMSEGAENIKMVSENGDYHEISFDIGKKYLQDILGGQDLDNQLGEEFSKMMEDMLKGLSMSMVVKIDKKTSYMTSAEIKMVFKDMPMVGDMSIVMDMDFSDFNGDIAVELPAEAQTAREVSPEELENQLPGSTLGI